MSTEFVVNLDGIPTEIKKEKLEIIRLKLDIGNPRIQYCIDTRLNDNIDQNKIKHALSETNDQYDRLKEHIEQNKGIYVPIWVVPDGDLYLVIEGNTRSFIYEELSEKYVNDENWKQIDAYILPHKVDRNVINFIRLEKHLFGQTPWSAYEKARELYRLHNEEAYTVKRLKALTKLSESEIKNSIQAFMDMDKSYLPKYPRPSERLKFSYFVEFRKNSVLKRLVKEGKLSLEEFCDWLGEGKFSRGEDIRKLPDVLVDSQAKEALVSDSFQAALDQLELKKASAKSKLFEKIEDVTRGLKIIPFAELHEIKIGLQPAKLNALKDLHAILVQHLDFKD